MQPILQFKSNLRKNLSGIWSPLKKKFTLKSHIKIKNNFQHFLKTF